MDIEDLALKQIKGLQNPLNNSGAGGRLWLRF